MAVPKRYKPPMYRMVHPKVPPTSRVHSSEVPTPVVAPPLDAVPPPTKPVAKKAPKVQVKKPTAKKAESKSLKWDESMTQKQLYRLAKDANLNVRSKDWKSEIIAEIEKYNKASSR